MTELLVTGEAIIEVYVLGAPSFVWDAGPSGVIRSALTDAGYEVVDMRPWNYRSAPWSSWASPSANLHAAIVRPGDKPLPAGRVSMMLSTDGADFDYDSVYAEGISGLPG